MRPLIISTFIILAIIIAGAVWVFRAHPPSPLLSDTPSTSVAANTQPLASVSAKPASPSPSSSTAILVEPVANFRQRVTKKPFGIYVSPGHSPVSPERFTGYHTGADAEYADISGDVPVYAVADGTVKLARWASGYGGVVAIAHTVNGQPFIAIYGHLNPHRLPAVGKPVSAGQQIGILGQGYSHDTDGERKHLHFGLYKGSTVNIQGYVSQKSQLQAWIDPLSLL